eukprot:TRINITY_DN13858_c0_g1::TRINITY_DN13858_c0_g1_i1::g.15435::m.15435 TRINITY_DN13858_c0_g1::TRINITY_DN13858_c0_g1_i1::g.15435  ORF type:complete len:105 (+),score=2.78 TRINITY_DN13858_c0_g1_i1:97-411(+)
MQLYVTPFRIMYLLERRKGKEVLACGQCLPAPAFLHLLSQAFVSPRLLSIADMSRAIYTIDVKNSGSSRNVPVATQRTGSLSFILFEYTIAPYFNTHQLFFLSF